MDLGDPQICYIMFRGARVEVLVDEAEIIHIHISGILLLECNPQSWITHNRE